MSRRRKGSTGCLAIATLLPVLCLSALYRPTGALGVRRLQAGDDLQQQSLPAAELAELEDYQELAESPQTTQLGVLAEKLETSPLRQPVLESATAGPSQGDPSLWSAQYASAQNASPPAGSSVESADQGRAQAPAPARSAAAGPLLPANVSTPPVLNGTSAGFGSHGIRPNGTLPPVLNLALDPPASLDTSGSLPPPDPVQVLNLEAASPPPADAAAALPGLRHRGSHGKRPHAHGKAHPPPGRAPPGASSTRPHGQQDLHDATMPQVELPRELPREVQEKERESAERAEEEGDARSVATAGSVAALEEHEKGYGAKLPPEVVGEFEEEARPTERGGDAGQQLPADREVQYETPHETNVVPGAVFLNGTGQSGERVKQFALSMAASMRSATGSSLTSMVVVVGAVAALLGVSVYYFRYMRSTPLQPPAIIDLGSKSKGPRFSRLRKQSSSNWEGDWDNDNWDDPGTGRIGDARPKRPHGQWEDEF